MSDSEVTENSKINDWAKRSVNLKLASIGLLVLVLLFPAMMIEGLIYERQARQHAAIEEIGSKWGGKQIIAGPVINIPFRKHWRDDKGHLRTRTEHAHFLPDDLNIVGDVSTEIRYRGIYEVIVYNTKLKISGSFRRPDFLSFNVEEENIGWDKAFLSTAISDTGGIRDQIAFRWGEKTLNSQPGIGARDFHHSGVHAPIRFDELPDSQGKINFSFSLDLNGTSTLQFLPLGKTTTVKLNSSWPSPSFQGAYLPVEREVKDGFSAEWKILDFNRDYPQQWIGNDHRVFQSAFGVDFFFPVDSYQKTTRASKYAALFIVLAFAVLFLAEILKGKRLHPIQYLLIGFAVCVFYLLLLSLSEHINFDLAYAIASLAIVGIVSGYSKGVFGSKNMGLVICLTMSGVYGFLYLVLQAEDYALLMGSIGLVTVQAAAMYLTRKVDWYNIRGSQHQ